MVTATSLATNPTMHSDKVSSECKHTGVVLHKMGETTSSNLSKKVQQLGEQN